jgi:hypothetical protein
MFPSRTDRGHGRINKDGAAHLGAAGIVLIRNDFAQRAEVWSTTTAPLFMTQRTPWITTSMSASGSPSTATRSA